MRSDLLQPFGKDDGGKLRTPQEGVGSNLFESRRQDDFSELSGAEERAFLIEPDAGALANFRNGESFDRFGYDDGFRHPGKPGHHDRVFVCSFFPLEREFHVAFETGFICHEQPRFRALHAF